MSLPTFPNENMTRDDAINQILSSIAMEEVGLSHIINAEGEKLQYVLGTLEGSTPPTPPTIDQVLEVNNSVKNMLDAISSNQLLLKGKMADALAAASSTSSLPVSITIGANGNWFVDGVDTGVAAQGPAGAEPVITVGSDGTWYVDGVSTGVTAQGAVGPQGPAGPEPVITVGSDGTWYVDGVSTGVTAQGAVGPQGPAGDTGPAGPAGTNGTNGVNGTGAILTFDSGSYTIPGVPPVLTLNTVVGNLANTSVYIGASMWGPQVSALGAAISLDSTGIPPWPMKVTKGGSITEWAASFESIAAAGINLAVLDPLGILGLTNPTVNASLLHAPALTSSPEALGDLNFTVIDTINLGEIPLVGVFSAYTGDHTLATPVTINAGDYLMVQFYINSSSALTVAVSVDGFHAQASVAIS